MMKALFAIMIVATAFSLAACGKSNGAQVYSDPTSAQKRAVATAAAESNMATAVARQRDALATPTVFVPNVKRTETAWAAKATPTPDVKPGCAPISPPAGETESQIERMRGFNRVRQVGEVMEIDDVGDKERKANYAVARLEPTGPPPGYQRWAYSVKSTPTPNEVDISDSRWLHVDFQITNLSNKPYDLPPGLMMAQSGFGLLGGNLCWPVAPAGYPSMVLGFVDPNNLPSDDPINSADPRSKGYRERYTLPAGGQGVYVAFIGPYKDRNQVKVFDNISKAYPESWYVLLRYSDPMKPYVWMASTTWSRLAQ